MIKDITVTALIVSYNAEDSIENAIESLINQDITDISFYEIIIVDGGSTDDTSRIIKDYEKRYPNIIKVYKNDKKILASGWNIGIKKSNGDFIFRIDAHATLDRDYLISNLNLLLKMDDVVAVGGILQTKSSNNLQAKLISLIQSTKFGVGNSEFRTGKVSKYVDTVAYGVYKKQVLLDVGLLNESYIRNQDNELHARLREAGWKFYLNASTKSYYHSRNTLKGMVTQAYGNGKWNIRMLDHSLEIFRLRYYVPLLFVCYLILEFILVLALGKFLTLKFVLVLYSILGFIFSYKESNNLFESFLSLPVYFLYHFAYGLGSLYEVLIGGN